MTKVRKKIGTIPINDIEQQVQQSTSAAITQMQQDVSDFIDEETAQYPEIGGAFKFQEDPEGRSEVKTDSDGKILSYRDSEGVMHENVGISTGFISLSEEGQKRLQEDFINNGFLSTYKAPHLPKYGTVNITSETFYLTSNVGYSDKNGVYIIRDFEDTDANASADKTLDFYYVKSSLKDNGDGTYSKYNDGVEGHDIKLDFYAASKVTKLNNVYYVTSSLTEIVDPETGDISYEVNANSIEVTQIVDVPDVSAWPVDKKTEHYCVVTIDFGHFLSGTFYIGIKFQGSSTLHYRKRNFRFTFYKNNKYEKKNKIKIGEFVRTSGFNLKANWTDPTRIKEVILNRFFMDIWKQRPDYDRLPWDKEFTPFTSASGMIKGFPTSIYIGGEFYGIDIFGLKKDKANFMLKDTDGVTPGTGLLVCGNGGPFDSTLGQFIDSWQPNPEYWDEELNDDEFCTVDGHTPEDSTALTSFLTFINSNDFTKENVPTRMDVIGWMDYFILMQVFIMFDNTSRNVVLYSDSNRTKFWPFFYDLDLAWYTVDFDRTNISINANILAPGTSFCADMTVWNKLWDLYRDEIITRYEYLRNNVLSVDYIKKVYLDIANNIPQSEIKKESDKWGTIINMNGIYTNIEFLKNRLKWLDENYFIK